MASELPTILLIESDPTLAEITAFRLELRGYRVVRAESAQDAFARLEGELPQAILLDTQVAGADGFEIANQLSNNERTSRIPLMVLSSKADLKDVERAYAAGAKDYLVTPYSPAVLESKLERLVHHGDTEARR